MISQTNNQFDQLKLEKEHKKAVAREDENAKVNVERTHESEELAKNGSEIF